MYSLSGDLNLVEYIVDFSYSIEIMKILSMFILEIGCDLHTTFLIVAIYYGI